ncbi:hypothetical protein [Nostoc sp.]|uniref:hypothetical protein n=1 Tax=Nostoc sp. TaxID=1180 RepID=UPI002FF63EC9
MGHGEEVTCLAHALCPKGWGDYPSPPTLGMEFPAAFNEWLDKVEQNTALVAREVKNFSSQYF